MNVDRQRRGRRPRMAEWRQAASRKQVDPASVAMGAKCQNLIDHRQAGAENTDRIGGRDAPQPGEPPRVLDDPRSQRRRNASRFDRKVGVSDAEAKHHILPGDLVAIAEVKGKRVGVTLHAPGCFGLDEIDPATAIPLSKQPRERIPDIKAVIAARGEIASLHRASMGLQPIDEVVGMMGQQAHATGGNVEAMEVEFRPICRPASETGIVADDRNLRRSGKQLDEIAGHSDR